MMVVNAQKLDITKIEEEITEVRREVSEISERCEENQQEIQRTKENLQTRINNVEESHLNKFEVMTKKQDDLGTRCEEITLWLVLQAEYLSLIHI